MAIGAVLSGAALTPRFGRHVLHAGFAVLIALQLPSAIGVAALGTGFFAALPSLGYVDGLERVLLLVVGLSVAAMLLALLLPRHPREEELG
jgi:uncharacterized membrane protein YgaE (UPF0421/DUF939 family)